MPEPWIKLRIHAEHPKVLRIAALTRLSKEIVLAMAIRWFRHVDAYLPDDNCIIDAAGINAVVQFTADANKGQSQRTFVDALKDGHVQWLSDADGGGYCIPEYEKHFSANAKRRGEESLRKRKERKSTKCPEKPGQMSDSPLFSSQSNSAPLEKHEDATPRESAPTPRLRHTDDENDADEPSDQLKAAVDKYCDSLRPMPNTSDRFAIHQRARELARPSQFGLAAILAGLEWGRANNQAWKSVDEEIRTATRCGRWDERKGDSPARVKAPPGKYSRFVRTK